MSVVSVGKKLTGSQLVLSNQKMVLAHQEDLSQALDPARERNKK